MATTLKVIITEDEQTFEGEIDPEESFMHALHLAIKQGKDPLDALAYLADEGFRRGDPTCPGWRNRVYI